jgi:Fibronectin type III domain
LTGSPQAVTGVSVPQRGKDSAEVAWRAPTDDSAQEPAAYYETELSLSNNDGHAERFVRRILLNIKPKAPGQQETLTVPGLLPNTPYSVRVGAADESGNAGSWSADALFRTAAQ